MIFFLSLLGLWISVYFSGIYYRWFSVEVPWVPKVCQMKEANCRTVLATPPAKLFGLPNSILGVVLYLYMFVGFSWLPVWITLVLLTGAVLCSFYLAWQLLFILKVPCPLCFASHVINLLLSLLVGKIVFFG